MIAAIGAIGVGVAAAAWLVALVRGPSSYDRLLCAHAARIMACAMLACLGVLARDPNWIDFAIAAALLDAGLVLAGVKALQRRSFQPALAPLEEG